MIAVSVIALTPGEPAGVGPDLAIQLAQQPPACALVLIADPALLAERAKQLHLPFTAREWRSAPGMARLRSQGSKGRESAGQGVYVLPVKTARPVSAGRLDTANAAYVIETLKSAVTGCRRGEFDALVTGPVHKGNLNDAGISFTGHTEFLAESSNAAQPVMMLACSSLRVALVTTHLPLAAVPRAITRERLTAVLEVLHADLRNKFGIANPVILVCGLNPHAGESGHLGREEVETIEPTIKALVAKGMHLRGPVPADTAFIPSQLRGVDAVLAMYHDQGLPVLKHHDFAHAVNITLGLPFVRTSVDHGTALELAGTGKVDPSSIYAAIELAIELAKKK
ncbi:MAG: 4-hydroxythreonine-4-phosphate dehydrogenase PdxA [Candidatus Muproteobacteria bacterium RIFCSPHIGHO2_12_FULL_60_33]|uniref:4-hydroxythreonine-4-phosphate dehydrogenase n=1 Tax=Candidatus Muproteobacteria bacterium RIFCSPLOWO2_01_FULL_60_18 TaxID=1817768 RepID=A0A1F6TZ36_9PROT|nr:MAG: 4-hydroxythreonine-4-phosphate dehydrogenase PdxA [Candidatus Muproteobacteria bacterium RIFCSPLOWO2_01_FULL_60_18]OGI55884.1 MAG: 4-hydroxythreonine-4-phosphate dehydrogenase PdxA [Candidatus Muproteobacteria bacterium RIFCSPHIGHO2_02_FULL_60_13]OGI56262.1 MAG: 4-hydroxythreonine-4-phosphate dehydrogenase PdxA [Candidatus Muproteobacteria bacterium RIFCSPHIGHO2_12_FULL_60_33]